MNLPALLVAGASVCLLSACTAKVYATSGELHVRHKVHLKLCPGMRGGHGTVSNVGNARVTAAHVVGLCDPNPWDRVSKELDLAVLTDGDPGECRNAELGEPLIYAGYPGTSRSGFPFETIMDLRVEQDTGTLLIEAEDVPIIDVRSKSIVIMKGMSRGSSTKTRGGYSGGTVMSAVDGRTVGIIVASGGKGKATWFRPIETVCEYIENGEDDE